MDGVLFKYGPGAAHVAFASGARHRRHVVLVGGLTDGLLALPYAAALAAGLEAQRWGLVQAQLGSSCTGWGLASLDQDAAELLLLARHLRAHLGCEVCGEGRSLLRCGRCLSTPPPPPQDMVLVGHSTGCQDAVRYVQRHGHGAAPLPPAADAARLVGAVLQGPVSDREWLASQPSTAARLEAAQAMVAEGRGEKVAFCACDIDGAAVTARRWCALAARGGDDDMFSSDLPLGELSELFAPLRGLPTLLLLR